MFVMTAKVDMKKILLGLAAAAALIIALVMFFSGDENAAPTVSLTPATNDGRVKFLSDFGWDVTVSPAESGQVKIPESASDVFSRYNALQKSQGYDLSQYVGKTVMRYVYKINNYPGATDPVYATVLVYKDQIIGGDVTDTSAKGVIRGFRMPKDNSAPQTTTPSTVPQNAQT